MDIDWMADTVVGTSDRSTIVAKLPRTTATSSLFRFFLTRETGPLAPFHKKIDESITIQSWATSCREVL